MRELVHSTQSYETERFKGSKKIGCRRKKVGLGMFEQTNKNIRKKFDFFRGRSETWLKPNSMRIGLFDSGG